MLIAIDLGDPGPTLVRLKLAMLDFKLTEILARVEDSSVASTDEIVEVKEVEDGNATGDPSKQYLKPH